MKLNIDGNVEWKFLGKAGDGSDAAGFLIAESVGKNKTKSAFLCQACGSIDAMIYKAVAAGQGYKVGAIKKEAEGFS